MILEYSCDGLSYSLNVSFWETSNTIGAEEGPGSKAVSGGRVAGMEEPSFSTKEYPCIHCCVALQ